MHSADLGKTVPQGMSLSYQICEILYECFTDQQPPAWEVRFLFDELEDPKKYNSKIDQIVSQIIIDGLCLDTEDYMMVENLEQKLSQWLEQKKETEKPGKVKKAVSIVGGVFLLLSLLTGIWTIYRDQLIFLGTETETVLLVTDKNMTQTDYNKAVDVVKKRVKCLTSKYVIKAGNGKIRIKFHGKFMMGYLKMKK